MKMPSVLNSGPITVNLIGGHERFTLRNPNLKNLVINKRCHLFTKTSISSSSKTQLCNTWSPDHDRLHRLLPAATKLTSWSAPERDRGLFCLRLMALLHNGFCLGALLTNMWLSKERWWLQKGFIIYVCVLICLAVSPPLATIYGDSNENKEEAMLNALIYQSMLLNEDDDDD